jgi:hypothetical protein
MGSSWRVARRHAAVLAAFVVAGFAAQSCAVMSSSSDCASKASCSADDEGGGPGGGSEAATAETGDDGFDATGQGDDVAQEGAAIDATREDTGAADVTTDGAAIQDVTSEPDGRLDASIDVLADRVVGAPDACVATGPELCSNGLDDNCDGKIDCADPACTGFTCAAPVPTAAGWTGPVLLWMGASTVTAPGCPTGYQTAFDVHAGPTGAADTCGCTCTASGQTCSLTGNFHDDQHCSAASCAATTPASNGACTLVPTNICGQGGSFEVGGGVAGAPTGGSCTPQMAPTVVPPAGWTTSARVCAVSGSADTPGGCIPSTEQCVAQPPATTGFVATPCVYQSGDIACPGAYPNNRTVLFSGQSDQRTCAGCTCTSAPTGGACAGTIAIFPDTSCTITPPPLYTLGTACLTYNGLAPAGPMAVEASYTVTQGSCSVVTQAQPTGSVVGTPSLSTTVCCM